MKVLVLIISFGLFGCSVTNVKPEHAPKYLEKEGYFTKPVRNRSGKTLPLCQKVVIKEIQIHRGMVSKHGMTSVADSKAIIYVEHQGQRYDLERVGEQYFENTGIGPMVEINQLDTHFVEKLKLGNAERNLCAQKIWTGMTKDQLLFVAGDPIDINRTVGHGKIREQWIYPGSSEYKRMYYYFEGDKLTSWQD